MVTRPFEVGDYVRFINEKQEGKITVILPSGNIIVDIEDGFPIEVTPKEIVKVQSGLQGKTKETPASTKASTTGEPLLPSPDEFRIHQEIRLLVIPEHSQVSTGGLKLYLLNTTSYQFLYSLSVVKDNMQTGIAAGEMTADKLIFLSDVKREELFEFDSFRLTGVLHTIMDCRSSGRTFNFPCRTYNKVFLFYHLPMHLPGLSLYSRRKSSYRMRTML